MIDNNTTLPDNIINNDLMKDIETHNYEFIIGDSKKDEYEVLYASEFEKKILLLFHKKKVYNIYILK